MGIKLQDNLGNDLLSDQSGFVGQNLIDNSSDLAAPPITYTIAGRSGMYRRIVRALIACWGL